MKAKKIIKNTLIVALSILVILLSITLIYVSKTISSVKDINVSLSNNSANTSTFYDINGNEIETNIDYEYVSLNDIPKNTINAFISIEDKEFYSHKGLNYKRMIGAMLNNIKKGEYAEGASTISQQLVKNKFLSNEKSITRKIKEAYLTKKLESIESKDEILESYLNTIYYGHGAYGIANASKMYFGKEVSDLTLSESCILAGIIKSPATYSPINNFEKCKSRRDLVLSELLDDKLISLEQYTNAINEDIEIKEELLNFNSMSLYARNALQEASRILGLNENEIIHKGYKIYTYQDNDTQKILDSVLSSEKYYPKNSYGNIADSLSIIIDNKTAGVKAISGRSDYDLLNFKRQPGSLIKPVLIYAPALEEKIIYPCSEILDEKTTIDNYTPQNVGDKYYGYVSIKDAVAKSLNTPAIKLCNELGVETCKEYGNKCGLVFDETDNGLAIALGGLTNGFTLQNITESYLPFTNNGFYNKSRYIKEIKNNANISIYIDKLSNTKYITQETAYLMTNILQYAVQNGTSKKLSNLNYEIAGKTGTVNVKDTNLNTDAYSLAYTNEITMSVWMGNYSMDKAYHLEGNNNGGTYATEIIKDTYELMYDDYIPSNFDIPESIVSIPIDTISLEKNHIVLDGSELPERYSKYELFSINNLPNKSTILNNISIKNFDVKPKKNSIIISFNADEYLKYEIYRIYNGSTDLIKTIDNSSGDVNYTDRNIEYNTKYEYYVIAKSLSGMSSSSQKLSAIIYKDYANLINEEDSLNFLFQ